MQKLTRNRQLASILQALIVSMLLLLPAGTLALEALSLEELNALQKVRESELLLLQESVSQQSELDSTEIAAIQTITAARKMKKSIERRGMTPSPELQHATKALQKKVQQSSKIHSDLLQLDEQLQLDGQDNQPIIELVVSDFGGPPPHKRLHRTDGKKKHHKHHHKKDEESNQEDQPKKSNSEDGEQDVESKAFDADELDAYTSNAINNQFLEKKRKGLGSHQDSGKKGPIDLTTSINDQGTKLKPQSLTQSQKKSESSEDSVDRAFSEPSVQNSNQDQQGSEQPPVAPQKLSQDSEKADQPAQKQEQSEEKSNTKAAETKPETQEKKEPTKQEVKSKNNDNENSVPVVVSQVDPNDEINAYSDYLNNAVDKNTKTMSSSLKQDSSPESSSLSVQAETQGQTSLSLSQSDEKSHQQEAVATVSQSSTDQSAKNQEELGNKITSEKHKTSRVQQTSDDLDDLDEHYSFESQVLIRNEETELPTH